MNYELAKKLKDAGFPQTGSCGHCGEFEMNDENYYHVPTLSELIEACGQGLILEISSAKGDTIAKMFGYGDKYVERGSTPEEAVANLWLELNKK